MVRAIDLDKAIEIIEEKQKELCPVGRYGRHYVYGSDREKYDAWEEIIDALDALPTLTPQNEPLTLGFDVVDKKTGKYPDWERIAREEDWAKGLVYCDMDGVAIREDGSLILLDECGNCVSCPPDRFEIRRAPEGEAK